jgi:serine phosphatase RsbU (regulator of sigma subunit)
VKRILKKLFLLLLAVLPATDNISGQAVTEEWLKSEYTVLLSGYFSWPEEEDIDTFSVGVLSSQAIYSQLSLKSELQRLKSKPFRVIYFKKPGDLVSVNILYIGEKKNKSIRKIYNRLEGQPVLRITDSCMENEFTMVNLLGMSLAGEKPFEINKPNIEEAGLSVSPKILLVGGSEDDLRDIYRELETEGDKMRAELDTLNKALDMKQWELAASVRELEIRSAEINRLIAEIDKQTKELTVLSDSVDLKELDLIEKIQLLGSQEELVRLREKEINNLNTLIEDKEEKINERSKLIEKQMEDIVLQTAMMKEQQEILDNQKIQIERQKMVLVFFLILVALILGLGFMIFRAYRIKKRANRILREKNMLIGEQKSDILNQKEEIEAQRDALQEVNKKIEKQNENITASIYYALTIQQAILPDVNEINKLFDTFIIYLPKDIVSGDFYWFTRGGRKRTGERSFYFAVVDCTGHGVPGGFLSMIGARMLDAIVNEQKVHQTDEILELMDKRIRKALNQHKTDNEDGMDVCLCKIILQGEKDNDPGVYLSFSGARRSLFLVRNGNEVEIIKGDRRTIGGKYFNPNPFLKHELVLKRSDRLYLTSDGLMDQNSPRREKYSTKRFIAFLSKNSSLQMKEQQLKLEEEVIEFMKYEKQRDDITIMGIKL